MDAIILGVKFLRSAMTCQSFLPSINILKNLNTSFNADYVALHTHFNWPNHSLRAPRSKIRR